MKILAAVLATAIAPVAANHGHQHVGPRTKEAMSAVETFCSRDVAGLCADDEPVVDPVSDLLKSVGIAPMVKPEPATTEPDISSILDQMIFMALQMPMEMPQQEYYYTIIESPSTFQLRVYGDEPAAERMQAPRDPAEHLLDNMVSSLAEEPRINPVDLTKTILQKGETIMNNDGAGEDDRRMARRLTEVHGGRHQNHSPLPFGCSKNRCLRSAYEQGLVTSRCSDAMQTAEKVYREEVSSNLLNMEHQKEAFLSVSLLYFALALCTIIVLHSRFRKHIKKIREQRKLADSILLAVYNDPEIKSKVEISVQKDLGYVPPLPPHVLARMNKPPMGHLVLLGFKIFITVVVIVLAFIDPLLAMIILCGVMLFRCLMVSMGWCLPPMPTGDCTCCCCKVSTEDLRLGKPLTKAQACCTCCNSTGVCPPTCKLCCGFDPDGGCDCCDDGCDCCSPKDVCTCCCCGLDSVHAKMGKLTEKQACCTCCNGTGACPDTCKACCGEDGDGSCDCCSDGCDCCSPKGKNTEVFEAVSIQIV
eukprot:CAMPEP_0194048716 /NCGR_PEP_ID=MMETSP0009_2-20130614/28251_1 /TAXON_ID=210454 /ORGANISM="Grammatophora oceanica, Strain CCMP 410" /LENGTH=531 /DNA_ID=CAMNT_0038694667 /DNA_START=33 /DNA_END=1628 /DNA_ORIENTATION=+